MGGAVERGAQDPEGPEKQEGQDARLIRRAVRFVVFVHVQVLQRAAARTHHAPNQITW